MVIGWIVVSCYSCSLLCVSGTFLPPCRTVVWSSMTRTVTAAIHWRTTCSVTPAMSRDWRKGPHLHPSTSTTSSKETQWGYRASLPGRCLCSTSELPHSWDTGGGGTGGRVPLCVRGYLSFNHSSVHSSSRPCVCFPSAFLYCHTLTKSLRKILQPAHGT